MISNKDTGAEAAAQLNQLLKTSPVSWRGQKRLINAMNTPDDKPMKLSDHSRGKVLLVDLRSVVRPFLPQGKPQRCCRLP
ncbi:MAG: hypothetical protein R2788_15775 [Saprospiraceae bacterium]